MMGKASDWLREERRTRGWSGLSETRAMAWERPVLGRWFEEFESELPAACPTCGGALLHRCPACNAPFSSAFAVECEECRAPLREPELLGVKIRRN